MPRFSQTRNGFVQFTSFRKLAVSPALSFAMTITVDTIHSGNPVKNWALKFLILSKILRVFEWFGNPTASVSPNLVILAGADH